MSERENDVNAKGHCDSYKTLLNYRLQYFLEAHFGLEKDTRKYS